MSKPVRKETKLDSELESGPDSWVELHADYLFSYVVKRVKSRDVAEDLVQDTFLSGMKAYANFRGDCSERSWLLTILRNKLIDHYRTAGREEPRESFEEFPLSSTGDFNSWGIWKVYVSNWARDPDKALESQQFMSALSDCLEKLPEKTRLVFRLKYLSELRAEDICKDLGLSTSNYWVVLYRARMALRKCIEDNWIKKS